MPSNVCFFLHCMKTSFEVGVDISVTVPQRFRSWSENDFGILVHIEVRIGGKQGDDSSHVTNRLL